MLKELLKKYAYANGEKERNNILKNLRNVGVDRMTADLMAKEIRK